MAARKLIYRLMVCAPGLFLAGLGFNARTMPATYAFVATEPCKEKLIQAYVPYLQQSTMFLSNTSKAKPEDVRKLAEAWIQGGQKGDLKPLTPVAYEDASNEGPKSQIFDANSKLVNRLISYSIKESLDGDYDSAAHDVSLAVALANVAKYSDFVSLYNSASQQRHAITMLAPHLGQIRPDRKKELASTISLVLGDKHIIGQMVKRSHRLFVWWRERQGYRPLSIEDTQLLSDIPALIQTDDANTIRQVRERIFASQDDHIPTYCSSLRVGIGAQELLDHEVGSILHQVK